MQTFLPYPDFEQSVAVLDTPRLGKQRVETLQVLRALALPEYGWQQHPAVRMWRGRRAALVRYGLTSVAEWRRRGFPDTTAGWIVEFAPEAATATQDDLSEADRLPTWLGDDRLHRSHRSRLLAKDPAHYGRLFADVPSDLEYYWPQPDDVADPVDFAAEGASIWVFPLHSAEALGRFLNDGAVGFGIESGVTADASAGDLAVLRAQTPNPTRRPTRPLVALSRFVSEVRTGDQVGVLVQDGRNLLLGDILGDYEHRPAAGVLTHRRGVRWDRFLPRTAVRPTYALQDVRPLFQARLAADDSTGQAGSADVLSGSAARSIASVT